VNEPFRIVLSDPQDGRGDRPGRTGIGDTNISGTYFSISIVICRAKLPGINDCYMKEIRGSIEE